MREVKRARPFHIDAWVVLPDHLHAIWTLPENDTDYSGRWREIKKMFSKALPPNEYRNRSQRQRGERGIWQPRFWEHTIRDETDYASHMDYLHFNPLKHRLVTQREQWPYSTFHRAVAAGLYPRSWAQAVAISGVGE